MLVEQAYRWNMNFNNSWTTANEGDKHRTASTLHLENHSGRHFFLSVALLRLHSNLLRVRFTTVILPSGLEYILPNKIGH